MKENQKIMIKKAAMEKHQKIMKAGDDNSEIIEMINLMTKSYSEVSGRRYSDNSDEDNNEDEITIELDNKYKHLSVKELKKLCKENNLKQVKK